MMVMVIFSSMPMLWAEEAGLGPCSRDALRENLILSSVQDKGLGLGGAMDFGSMGPWIWGLRDEGFEVLGAKGLGFTGVGV